MVESGGIPSSVEDGEEVSMRWKHQMAVERRRSGVRWPTGELLASGGG
jgi:hypothetical protein